MRFSILLVEDAEADVWLVREALDHCGLEFDLGVLDDGEKAIDFVNRADGDESVSIPDLVLLDLNLPKRSGWQVLDHLRSSSKLGDLPVVVLTSSDSPNDKAAAVEFKATAYFRKASNLDDFMKLGLLVRELLHVYPPTPAEV
jgi:chemotaxis family two-component system response regulator Rcp1